MKTLARVLAYVENSPAILHAYDATRRGDEPPTLCLVIASESEALTVFEQLTVLIPPNRGRLPKIKPPPPVVLRFNGGK